MITADVQFFAGDMQGSVVARKTVRRTVIQARHHQFICDFLLGLQ
jgi:hypothetical protein